MVNKKPLNDWEEEKKEKLRRLITEFIVICSCSFFFAFGIATVFIAGAYAEELPAEAIKIITIGGMITAYFASAMQASYSTEQVMKEKRRS